LILPDLKLSRRKPERLRHDVAPTDSVVFLDHLPHGLSPPLLQWTLAGPRDKPDAFVFLAAVNNVYAVRCDGVVKCGTGVLRDEPEERFAPWILYVRKYLIAELFELVHAGRANRFCDGLTAFFGDLFKIKFVEWHLNSFRGSKTRCPLLLLTDLGSARLSDFGLIHGQERTWKLEDSLRETASSGNP
jgi:hypothetical protein